MQWWIRACLGECIHYMPMRIYRCEIMVRKRERQSDFISSHIFVLARRVQTSLNCCRVACSWRATYTMLYPSSSSAFFSGSFDTLSLLWGKEEDASLARNGKIHSCLVYVRCKEAAVGKVWFLMVDVRIRGTPSVWWVQVDCVIIDQI